MKHTLRITAVLAATALATIASAQTASNITTFVVPYQINNSAAVPMRMVVECGLFVNQRLVSLGTQTINVAQGNTAGNASVGMHWPLRENPSRINRFACQVVPDVAGRSVVSVAGDPGLFSLPHAGPRHYVSGAWPR
jgi:hypothetical protein